MKILQTVDISTWNHEIVCIRCDSRLQIDPEDLMSEIQRGDRPGEGDSRLYYTYCPVCDGQLIVPEKEIPKVLQVKIQDNFFDRGRLK